MASASLVFSTSTWNTLQTVTVTGWNNTETDGDQTWDVRLDPEFGDSDYDTLANVDVEITTLDDEGALVVNSVTIPSRPAAGNTYALGETISVEVGFDRAARVTGSPQLGLMIGTVTRQAAYATGGGTATLTFRYRVQAGGTDGLSIGAGALTLNGGTTVDAELGLGFRAIADSANYKVAGGGGGVQRADDHRHPDHEYAEGLPCA